jgi:hypothetical protein
MTYFLEPPEGWSHFSGHERLVEAVFEGLPLAEEGGAWRYYNFTSDTSLWDADLPERNWLLITYLSSSRGTRVIGLQVEQTPAQHPCAEQLERLVRKLRQEFGLQVSNLSQAQR